MQYTKIKIEDKYYPKRLYRIVALKGNPKLSTLGAVFGKIFEADFEHYFMFRSGRKSFVASSWIEQFDDEDEYSISSSFLDDLDDEFEYEYDTGEGYLFKCKKYKNLIDINKEDEDSPDVIVLEGKGAGIFENNHGMLEDYLSGRLSDDSFNDNEDEYYMPYNLELEKLSDFDNELDLDNYEFFYEDVSYIADHFDDEIIENPSYNFEEEDEEIDEWLLREEVAADIFNSDKVNKVFRQLIKNVDINDAYEMLVKTYKEIDELDEKNNYSADEYGKLFDEKINSLIRN